MSLAMDLVQVEVTIIQSGKVYQQMLEEPEFQ